MTFKHLDCNKHVVSNGLCVKHGASLKTCREADCDNNSRGKKKKGYCQVHFIIHKDEVDDDAKPRINQKKKRKTSSTSISNNKKKKIWY